MKIIIIFLVKFYQMSISPFLGTNCRFSPSCSQYTLECLERFTILKGLWYSFIRIIKCHPFNPGGYDPVPGSNCYSDNLDN